jgi:ubiquinone/menaquinone biosynthesis C-methylase UbiE
MMIRHLRLREFLAGVQGVALMRGLFTASDEDAERRIEELREIVSDSGDPRLSAVIEIPSLDVAAGYERWSTTYDSPGNPLISAEQPVVWKLLERESRGRALDAACGTGRHTLRLVELGHEVIAVDATPAMMAQAERKVPGAQFVQGDVNALPLEDDSVDFAVCALALEHVADLRQPMAELARVIRPGGSVIISESHPVLRAIGGAPFFEDATGASGVVRNYNHSHGDYLDAFAKAKLELRRCIDVPFGREQVAMQQPAVTFFPEAAEAAFLGLPAVLVWDLAVGPAL